MEPVQVQLFMGIMSMPWSFRFLYGFLADNVDIMGKKRKVQILVNSFVNIVLMTLVMSYGL